MLPLGRWSCTIEDLDSFHDSPDAQLRAELWQEWEQLTEMVRVAVGRVPAVWLSGSYFTAKERPSDIDCVYILDRDDLQRARENTDAATLLEVVSKSQVKNYWNLRVDSYVLEWWPRLGINRGSDVRRETYLEMRGYWDDLWQRDRTGDNRSQKIPRKGYLEVILDGYS